MDQSPGVQPFSPSQPLTGFVKDPLSLTRFLIVTLWAHTATSIFSALTSAVLLATGRAGQPEAEGVSGQDIFLLLLGLVQLVVIPITSVVFLMWIYRANRNARGMGARGMTFSPGWSVGWYFIPIANLWKPYQAMKQIWQASANPAAWSMQKPPTLLSTWWAVWIVSNILSNAAFRSSLHADTPAALVSSEVINLLSDVADVFLCLVAIRLVREIIRLQSHWAAQPRHTESICEICRQPFSASDLVLLGQTQVCAGCKPLVLQQMREGVSRT